MITCSSISPSSHGTIYYEAVKTRGFFLCLPPNRIDFIYLECLAASYATLRSQ